MTEPDPHGRCVVGEAIAPGVPNAELKPDGQQKGHVILCDAERLAGFVRPVRDSYRHVGIRGPRFPLRDLTEKERQSFGEDYGASFAWALLVAGRCRARAT